MDFSALTPEINSGRMYAGAGVGPMLAAATAWESLAGELTSTASAYNAIVTGLTGQAWSGAAATSMAAAAMPYAAWMSYTAGKAEQAAVQVRTAAAAYEAAFAATVPPGVIDAHRSLLLTLVATTVFGQTTPAIAATELHYAEMWAQDAVAMFGYAGAAASATTLDPFNEPPPTVDGTGLAAQLGAVTQALAQPGAAAHAGMVQLIAAVPQTLQSLSTAAPAAQAVAAPAQAFPLNVLDALSGPLSPISLFGIGGIPYLLAIQCVLLPMNGSNVVASVVRAQGPKPWLEPPVGGQLSAGLQLAGSTGPAPVSAGLGSATPVGRLSVPPSWSAEPAAVRTVSAVLPGTGTGAVAAAGAAGESGALGDLALGGLAGRAIGVTGGAASAAVPGPTGSLAGSRPDAAAGNSKTSKATIIVIPPSAEDR